MKTPLAWRNTVHNKFRTLTAVSGVAFAILLVFMQLGFYGACRVSATMIYDLFDFDAVIISPQYVHLRKTGTIPRIRLRQAAAAPGVQAAQPVFVLDAAWRNPEDFHEREILVLGVNPDTAMFAHPQVARSLSLIVRPDVALMDAKAQPIFGPHHKGVVTEVNGRQIQIVENYLNGTGFIAGANIIVNESTFHNLMGGYPLDQPQLGIVRFEPGADRQATIRRLREALPVDAVVWSRERLEAEERHFFVNVKPIGFMFKSGVLIGFLVGAVILYQILAGEISNRIRELATLKAIGYGPGYLHLLVMKQGAYFAILGFVPALALSIALYGLVRTLATIPMHLTMERVLFVFGLSVAMCSLSGLLAIRKLNAADPAELF